MAWRVIVLSEISRSQIRPRKEPTNRVKKIARQTSMGTATNHQSHERSQLAPNSVWLIHEEACVYTATTPQRTAAISCHRFFLQKRFSRLSTNRTGPAVTSVWMLRHLDSLDDLLITHVLAVTSAPARSREIAADIADCSHLPAPSSRPDPSPFLHMSPGDLPSPPSLFRPASSCVARIICGGCSAKHGHAHGSLSTCQGTSQQRPLGGQPRIPSGPP
mmetsp:Transcript_4128/g.9469  ORF Transcript_4128/g.9469 Transcript_4128/m.9469 type:complete len:218 (+) Transcript_4128:774-1427(+)